MKHKPIRYLFAALAVSVLTFGRTLGAMPFGEAALLGFVVCGFPVLPLAPAYALAALLRDPTVGGAVTAAVGVLAAVLCRFLRTKNRWIVVLLYLFSRTGGLYGVLTGDNAVRWAAGVLLGAPLLAAIVGSRPSSPYFAQCTCCMALFFGTGTHVWAPLAAFVAGLGILILRRGGGLIYGVMYGIGGMLALWDPAPLALYAVVFALGAAVGGNRFCIGAAMLAGCAVCAAVTGTFDPWTCGALALGAGIGACIPMPAVRALASAAAEPPAPSPLTDALLSSAAACRNVEIVLDGEQPDLDAMADALSATLCEGCTRYASCRVDAACFRACVGRAVGSRRAGLDVLPDALVESCCRAAAVPQRLSAMLKEYECDLALNDLRTTAASLVASQLSAFSGLLARLAEQSRERTERDAELTTVLHAEIDGVRDVVRCGRSITVTADVACGESIARAVGEATHTPVSVRSVTERGGGYAYRLLPSPRLGIVYGVANTKKRTADACGDTYCVRELASGALLAVLCDGMGSGKGAAAVSERTIGVIESCFSAGFDTAEVIRMVNFLLALGGDRFSCVDLCVADLDKAEATFVKMGGVQSLLVRDGAARRIEGGALPMGVQRAAAPSVTTVDLRAGDVIVLTTDGVTDALDDPLPDCANPRTAAERILERAVRADGGAAHDDMTVLVLRVL